MFYNGIIIGRKKEKTQKEEKQSGTIEEKENGRCEKLLLFVSREYNIDIFSIWVLENLETMKTWNSIFTKTVLEPYFTLLVRLLIKMWNTNKRWRTVGYEANSSNLWSSSRGTGAYVN